MPPTGHTAGLLPKPTARTRRFAAGEIAAMVFLYLVYIIGHFFYRLHIGFILAVGLAAIAYAVWRVRRGGHGLLRFWGFRLDTVAASAAVVAPVTAAVVSAMILWWWFGRSHPPIPPAFYLLLPLYPVWGIAQQFFFQSLFHRDLQILTGKRGLPILLTALAFGLLHAVDPILALLSFAAGLGWSAVFAWRPNLLVVGTSHGLVGGVFFYFAAGTDVLRLVL
jgi:hypothetical protein